MFLQRCTVRNLVIAVERGLESKNLAMLWLAAYAFLLRVPSEALPMCRGGGDFDQAGVEQSVLFLKDDNCLCLRLKSRKNKAEGTVLKRGCSCAAHEKTCPIHVLWHGCFEKLCRDCPRPLAFHIGRPQGPMPFMCFMWRLCLQSCF